MVWLSPLTFRDFWDFFFDGVNLFFRGKINVDLRFWTSRLSCVGAVVIMLGGATVRPVSSRSPNFHRSTNTHIRVTAGYPHALWQSWRAESPRHDESVAY